MDDDTYYNMDLFEQNFRGMNSSQDIFYAGCLIRWPIHEVNFTFPHGGFGSIFSRESLRNLFRPINCADSTNSEYSNTQAICNQLAENTVGEKKYFANGMNLVELMYYYTATEKYRDINSWKSGYCMHSDWVMGYFVNYYNVSKHVDHPYYKDVPHARIEAYKGSVIYSKATGFCKNDEVMKQQFSGCRWDVDICHRVSLGWMKNQAWRSKTNRKTWRGR